MPEAGQFAGLHRPDQQVAGGLRPVFRLTPELAVQPTIDALRPARWELWGLAGLVSFLFVAGDFGEFLDHATLNWIAPSALLIVLSLGAVRMVRIEANAIWTSLFWFRVSTAAYFGFGSLVPLMVNATTRLYIEAFYPAQPSEIFKLNLIVALSCLLVLSSAAVCLANWPRQEKRGGAAIDRGALLFYGCAFAVVGYSVKLLVELPLVLGAFGSDTVAGVLLSLGQVSAVGLYMLTLYALRYNRVMWLLAIALLSIDVFVGALTFSKTAIMMPMLMFLLAWLSQGMTVRRLAMATALFAGVFALAQPFISAGRDGLIASNGSLASGSLTDRLGIALSYDGLDGTDPFEEQLQGGFARMSYTNGSAFAIALYDAGTPAPWLDNVAATLVPRFFWPEKPVITDIGLLFNSLATGNASSSSAPGLFADAYWAFGWAGIPLMMVPLGILFALFSGHAIGVQESGRWLYFPIVLFTMRMGTRVDGFLIADVIGTTVFIFWAYVGLRLIETPVNAILGHARAGGAEPAPYRDRSASTNSRPLGG